MTHRPSKHQAPPYQFLVTRGALMADSGGTAVTVRRAPMLTSLRTASTVVGAWIAERRAG